LNTFTEFLVHDVCQDLGESVSQTLEDNANFGAEIGERIAAILNDILAVTGNEDEDHLQLEIRLRNQFSKNSYHDRPDVEVPISLPSQEVPAKCTDVSYEDLHYLIHFMQDSLQFEAWLQLKLESSCKYLKDDFQTVLDDVQ
jgi:hypothetical protein